MAVVYDPENAQSRADAEAIKFVADQEREVADGARLVAVLVPVGDLRTLKGARVFFVAEGLSPKTYDRVAEAAVASGILSMSADLGCVRAGKCVLGISTRPTVEIYFNRDAAAAAHVEFSAAFIMLARPI